MKLGQGGSPNPHRGGRGENLLHDQAILKDHAFAEDLKARNGNVHDTQSALAERGISGHQVDKGFDQLTQIKPGMTDGRGPCWPDGLAKILLRSRSMTIHGFMSAARWHETTAWCKRSVALRDSNVSKKSWVNCLQNLGHGTGHTLGIVEVIVGLEKADRVCRLRWYP